MRRGIARLSWLPALTFVLSVVTLGTIRFRTAPSTANLGAVRQAMFSPDGQRVTIQGDDGQFRIWDARTGRPVEVQRMPLVLPGIRRRAHLRAW